MSRRNGKSRTKACLQDGSNDSLHAWKKLFKTNAPTRMREEFRCVLIAYAQQERAPGSTFRVIDQQFARIQHDVKAEPTSQNAAKSLGARLIRGWGGENHEVMVLEKGFSYRGNVYRSLSEIARLITGVHWSGPRFFGLKSPKEST